MRTVSLEKAIEYLEKGSIIPSDFTLAGELTPRQSRKLLDMVVQQSDFLQRITRHPMDDLKVEVPAIDVLDRSLKRIPEGTEPSSSDWVGVTYKGRILHAEEVNLPFAVVYSTLIVWKKSGEDVEKKVANAMAKRFANDLLDLGFNGDSASSDNFLKLNDSWTKIAKTDGDTHKINFTSESLTKWSQRLEAVVSALPEKYHGKAVLVMRTGDYRALVKEIAGDNAGAYQILLSGKVKEFLGYEIVPVPYVPPEHVIFTPIENFVFGYLVPMRRYRRDNPMARQVEYLYSMHVDFQFSVADAVAIGHP